MSVTLVTTPTYALPGIVRINATVTVGDYFRAWCTAAPPGSSFREQLDATGASLVLVHEGAAAEQWRPTLEVGGAYTFTLQDITHVATSHGGGYQEDPNGYVADTVNATSTGVVIYVGEAIEFILGRSPDVAKLRVYVWNDSIRATTIDLHGEETPRIVDDGLTVRARTAARDATVLAQLDSLTDGSSATVMGSLGTIVEDIRAGYDAHRTQAGVHYANDTDNTISGIDLTPNDMGMVALLPTLRDTMYKHFTSDSGTGSHTGSYHQDGSENTRADLVNAPILSSAGTIANAYALAADLHRAYEAHRVDATFHSAADTTNALSGLPPLAAVHSAFLAQLAASSPTVPATDQPATVRLIQGAGGELVS